LPLDNPTEARVFLSPEASRQIAPLKNLFPGHRIGEGENGTVFDYLEDPGSVFKVAKPRPYCRNHLLEEAENTELSPVRASRSRRSSKPTGTA
jgi:hypothetical protein